MGYILYSVSITILILATVLYFTRQTWLPPFLETYYNLHDHVVDNLVPTLPEPIYSRLPTSFHDDIESGLSSSAFDLHTNIEAGDSRHGLDDKQRREVLRIMKRRGVGFDEARRMWMEERFRREGIGADGLPRDPKFVSFS